MVFMCFINRHSHHWGGTTAPSCGAHLVRSRKKESSDSVGSNGHEVSADDVRSIWEGYLNTSIFCTKNMYRYLYIYIYIYIYVCIFFCKYMCIYIYKSTNQGLFLCIKDKPCFDPQRSNKNEYRMSKGTNCGNGQFFRGWNEAVVTP